MSQSLSSGFVRRPRGIHSRHAHVLRMSLEIQATGVIRFSCWESSTTRKRSALSTVAATCNTDRPRTSLIDAGTPSEGPPATPRDSPTRQAFPLSFQVSSLWSMQSTTSRWIGQWARCRSGARRRTILSVYRNQQASSWSRRLPALPPLSPPLHHVPNKPGLCRRARLQRTATSRTTVVSGGSRCGRRRESSCCSRRRSASTSVAMRMTGQNWARARVDRKILSRRNTDNQTAQTRARTLKCSKMRTWTTPTQYCWACRTCAWILTGVAGAKRTRRPTCSALAPCMNRAESSTLSRSSASASSVERRVRSTITTTTTAAALSCVASASVGYTTTSTTKSTGGLVVRWKGRGGTKSACEYTARACRR
mmetsp:Transcript_19031/g.49974  ORF Transcript_19031/g.49974 Transcript_19031/m.49974 type:complete len:366 (-) Transcript_19031:75-1172(-)